MKKKTEFDFSTIMVPLQAGQRARYVGDVDELPARLYKLIEEVAPLRGHLSNGFHIEWSDRVDNDDMASQPLALNVLQFMLGLFQPKAVLEIGTFVGVGTLHMTAVLPPSTRIVTIEKYDHFAELCRRNFAANGVADRIELIEGDALEVMDRLVARGDRFDFVFLDGDKAHYVDYFNLIDPLLEVGGLFVADNMFFQCDVANDVPVTDKGEGVLRFLKHAGTLNNYRRALVPYCDGTMFLHKLA